MKDIPLSEQKAVALKYPKGAEATFVIANGKGLLAKRILEEARQNDIKIEENKQLVEFLSLATRNHIVFLPMENDERRVVLVHIGCGAEAGVFVRLL